MIKYIFCILLIGATAFTACKKQLHFPNTAPVANAGKDTTIVVPANSALLDASASTDPDNNISNYAWTKILGPSSNTIVNANTVKSAVNNLSAGVYLFELKVTDAAGLFAKDTVQVTVQDTAHINRPPVANAGRDTIIILPANAANLDGSLSTDPGNNISSYAWAKISGPASFTILNKNAVKTPVTTLIEGVYQFELKVTDAAGLFSKDTIMVTVKTISRQVVNTQLLPFGKLSEYRTGITVASAGSKILFAGGYIDDGIGSSTVDIYDTVMHSWSVAKLSVERYNIIAVTLGNKIFFAGGHTLNSNNWDLFANVDIYDASTGVWSVAHLSERRMDLAATTVGNKIFFAGGLGGAPDIPPQYVSGKIDIYDNSTNSWSTASLGRPVACLSGVTARDKIYFSGGNTTNASYTTSCSPSNIINIIDGNNGSMSLSEMKEPLAFRGAIFKDNNIYWAGGENWDCSNSSIQYYSSQVEITNIDSQTSSYASLFQPNSRFKVITKGSKIVFFVGEGTAKDRFDIYDTSTNSWTIGVMNTAFANVYTGIANINNTIYVAEGDQVWTLEF